jgi:hypothetical protein
MIARSFKHTILNGPRTMIHKKPQPGKTAGVGKEAWRQPGWSGGVLFLSAGTNAALKSAAFLSVKTKPQRGETLGSDKGGG